MNIITLKVKRKSLAAEIAIIKKSERGQIGYARYLDRVQGAGVGSPARETAIASDPNSRATETSTATDAETSSSARPDARASTSTLGRTLR